jgi:hypothetical protein
MTTDRPDTTESPFTIDAGHVQLESDVASHTRSRQGGVTARGWSIGAFNVRLGLASNWEAGIFVAPWTRVVEKASGEPRQTRSGFGDLTLRTKVNFWGNDGGATAGGLIADLKLPTATGALGNDAVEGGIILPVSFELGGGFEGGAMTELDLRRREPGRGRQLAWLNTLTVGHELSARLGGYLELTSEVGEETHVATFNLGLAFRPDANTQLDCGVNLGLTRAADDVVFFAGISRRY